MTLAQYNAIELAYMRLQYVSFTRVHPMAFEDYVINVCAPKWADNFRRTWEPIKFVGLENVVDGND